MGLILASASPRRCELLKFITEDFKVYPSGVEENVPNGMYTDDISEYLANIKAEDVFNCHKDDTVIGADTSVIYNGIVLGKPKNQDDAFKTLKMLSSNIHKVITGCSIVNKNCHMSFSVTTYVEFYKLTDEEILDYIKTGEPFDKAGSYGIQGLGSLFVKKIEGDYFNVVGLPISSLSRKLKANF